MWKMINKIVILLTVGLFSALAKNPEEDINYNGHQWHLGIIPNDKRCEITPVKPRIFLADAECLRRVIDILWREEDSPIWVHWEAASGSLWSNIAVTDKKNVFFDDEFNKFLNKSHSVGMVITEEPVVPFSIKSEISQNAADLFSQRQHYYNKRRQIVHVNNDTEDIDFTNCTVPLIGTNQNIQIGPCNFTEIHSNLACPYNYDKIPLISRWQRLGIEVFCNSIKSPEKKFLAGLIRNKFDRYTSEKHISELRAEYVGDMWEFIDRKWKELYPTAPEEFEEFGL